MKKLLTVFIILSLLLCGCSTVQNGEQTPAPSITPTPSPVEDFEYSVYSVYEDSHILIDKYIGEDPDVVIPSEIDGLPVTGINICAFSKLPIESVYMPDTVTAIGDEAFFGCEKLKSVRMSNSLKNICTSAFSRCSALEEIKLPSSLTQIEHEVFTHCDSLKKVYIPASITEWIGHGVFGACDSLTEVILEDGLTAIGIGAFMQCESLKTVEIPASVKEIRGLAFRDCPKLETVTFKGDAPNLQSGVFDFFIRKPEATLTIYYPANSSGWDAEIWQEYNLISQ